MPGRTPASPPASRGCPVNPNHSEINAVAAQADPASVFNHYRALIALRHDHPLVVDGRFELLLPDHPQLWVDRARDAATTACSSCSPTARRSPSRRMPLTSRRLAGATVLLATHPGREGLDLLPWESRILRGAVVVGCRTVAHLGMLAEDRPRGGSSQRNGCSGVRKYDASARHHRWGSVFQPVCPTVAGSREVRRWVSPRRRHTAVGGTEDTTVTRHAPQAGVRRHRGVPGGELDPSRPRVE